MLFGVFSHSSVLIVEGRIEIKVSSDDVFNLVWRCLYGNLFYGIALLWLAQTWSVRRLTGASHFVESWALAGETD